jgi:hypothetical protein
MKQSYLASSHSHSLTAHPRRPFHLFGAVMVAALTATGCAMAPEGKYDWHQGWSEATVVRIGNAAALDGRYFSDCRFQADAGQAASGQFVVLSYEHLGRTRHRVVPLRNGEAYRPGDRVYMNVNSCKTPLVARTGTVRK